MRVWKIRLESHHAQTHAARPYAALPVRIHSGRKGRLRINHAAIAKAEAVINTYVREKYAWDETIYEICIDSKKINEEHHRISCVP